MQDLISVIIPVYNVKEYVDKCINSVLQQSYEYLEIIIVDDGSTDGSGKICDKFNDTRIKVIHKKNGGLSSARNAGLNIATGKYICFVDSDDYIDVDMVESLYQTCEEYSCDLGICRYRIVGASNADSCELDEQVRILSGKEALEQMLGGKIKSFAWNKMYRRSLFDTIRFPEGKVYEDIYIMHNIFLQCDKICCIPNCAYYYVWRKGSIMHQYSIKNSYDNYMALMSRLNDLESLGLKNIGGLYADIIRIRMYFEITKCKVSLKERKQHSALIHDLEENYSQLYIPDESEDYLSNNEKLKYWILKKSRFLFRHIIGANYDGCRRKKAEAIIRYFRKTNFQPKSREYNSAVWIVGLPEYNNLGDCAIGYATLKFVEENCLDKDIFCISEKQFFSQWRKIRANIRRDDIIVLQGGGNITDIYPDQQTIRRKVIQTCKNNEIVIMPQTVYFSKTPKGNKEKNKTYSIYKKCKQLTLACRETITFEWVKKNYPEINSILCPDIVLSLRYDESAERQGIMFCIRSDIESSWAINYLPNMKKKCMELDSNIVFSDTVIRDNVTIGKYSEAIKIKLNEFAQKKLVITDRLHGVIFAAITGTPCIAIDNFNHKIRGICQWMEEADNIFYVSSYEHFEIIMDSLELSYGNEWLVKLEKEFNELRERIKK